MTKPISQTRDKAETRTGKFLQRLALTLSGTSFLFAGYFAGVTTSHAAMGTIDTRNDFPYVVRIDMGNGSYCSGVVTSDNLVTTAAHCVFDLDTKVLTDARQIQVFFRDIYGAQKSVGVRNIFIPDGYRKVEPLRFSSMANQFLQVRQDVAILIPDDVIEVEGYSHWITELLQHPYSDYLSRVACPDYRYCTNLSATQEDDLVQILTKELGPLRDVKALIVGYGGFACRQFIKDDEGHDDCQRDNQKRVAEAPLAQSANGTARKPSNGGLSENLYGERRNLLTRCSQPDEERAQLAKVKWSERRDHPLSLKYEACIRDIMLAR
jgi:hypothetical protein